MQVVQINSCVNGSTGTIMKSLQKYICEKGDACTTATRKDYSKLSLTPPNHVFIGGLLSKHIDSWRAYQTGKEGLYSYHSTQKLLKHIEKIDPQVIHLHNLHSNYVNLELLFAFFKTHKNIKIIWTLHDCWSFTGHCPYFEIEQCDKWKNGCHDCKLYMHYPECKKDNSKYMYFAKKRIFNELDNMIIVTPSEWLGNLVKQSFLKNYPVKVINNGINTEIFKPYKSQILAEKCNINQAKKVVLGVASIWEERKGLEVFKRLSKEIGDKIEIVLIGVTPEVKETLPRNIYCIERTENQQELAEIYSAADIFVNPTMEENYPTVNIESICCGTPVITYDTGGSGEIVRDGCGAVVPRGNYEELKKQILKNEKQTINTSILTQMRSYYSWRRMAEQYYNLYREK